MFNLHIASLPSLNSLCPQNSICSCCGECWGFLRTATGSSVCKPVNLWLCSKADGIDRLPHKADPRSIHAECTSGLHLRKRSCFLQNQLEGCFKGRKVFRITVSFWITLHRTRTAAISDTGHLAATIKRESPQSRATWAQWPISAELSTAWSWGFRSVQNLVILRKRERGESEENVKH